DSTERCSSSSPNLTPPHEQASRVHSKKEKEKRTSLQGSVQRAKHANSKDFSLYSRRHPHNPLYRTSEERRSTWSGRFLLLVTN
uniref:Uncharacterized protein n=1 Tax=Aegilops tauschii subsp. strangulata TaxID=200361 RepID=A0A453BWP0_AEGTS